MAIEFKSKAPLIKELGTAQKKLGPFIYFGLLPLLLLIVAMLCAVLANGTVIAATDSPEVRVGSELDFPPYAFIDESGQPAKFSVDLIKAVANAMSLPIKISTGTWDDVWNTLVDSRLDILPIVAKLPDRLPLVDFSLPHTETYDAFFVRHGNSPLKNIEAAKGKNIVVMRSDAAHHALLEHNFRGNLVLAGTIPEGLSLISSGKHDAFLCSKLIGAMLINKHGLKDLVAGPIIPDYKRVFSFAVKKGDAELLEKLNQGLLIIKTNGEYDRIYNKWLPMRNPWQVLEKYLFPAIVIAITLALIVFFWLAMLHRLVKKRTRELFEKSEMLRLAQDGLETEVAQRTSELEHANLTLQSTITDRKQAEEALQETSQRLEAIIQASPAAIIVLDSQGLVTHWSPGAEKIFGWLAEEVLGRMNPIVPENKLAEFHGLREQVLKGKSFSDVELIRRKKDGAPIPISLSTAPLRNLEGTIAGIMSVSLDITDRKRTEEVLAKNYSELHDTAQRLEQSRSMLQLIIESIPVRVFWKDSDLRYMGCNTLFARDAGLSQPQQLLGKDDFAMGWREQADLYRADDRQVMESRRPKLNIIEPQTTPTGAKIWLDTSKVPLQMPNGEVFGVLGVYEDITARQHAEEALRESEEKFRLVFEKAPLGIMHYDLTSTITDCNEKFAEIIGTPKEKFIGFNLMRQLRDDKMREAVAASLKGEIGYYEGDYLSVIPKKLTPVRAIYQPIFSSNGALSGGVSLFEDVSERKQAELERLQFSKLESLGTLAGGIAHDFNNILTAILGNIGLAALDDKIGPRVKDRLAQAEAACLRAEALSKQLLTFAKGGAPVKELLSVPELLTETTVFACVGSPVKSETTFPENLWSIEADPGQIGQVFQNLTINAIQAMPTGGTIKVWAENLTLGTESGLPLSAGKYIRISVRDQGMGIPAQHLPRIFDPYFTTKQKGSGLGLASAYAIIKKHHGHIAVESKSGVGTTFDIYLPAVEQQATPQPAEDRELLVGTGKILVMDDEEMVREVLGRLLARLGYEAEFARDGGEAIAMFVQAHGSGQAFAGVILDLTVPGAMGGKETMARLLEIDPQVKAVVSSGYSDDPIMADFQKYGFSEVIAKPYKISELGNILNKVILKKA